MRPAAIATLLLALAACGEPDPVTPPIAPPTEPDQPTPEPELPVPRGRNLHVASELIYEALPDAPHRLIATYQGLELARWTIQRVADEDGDRRIEYRAGQRVFLLPQDSGDSVEYGPGEREQVLRRFELRRVAMTMGLDEPVWDEQGGLELGGELGRIERSDLADDGVELTCSTPDGATEESLRITAWQQHGKGRRPARLELWFGAAHVWTETIDSFEVESWFKQRFFWPPDRADEAAGDE